MTPYVPLDATSSPPTGDIIADSITCVQRSLALLHGTAGLMQVDGLLSSASRNIHEMPELIGDDAVAFARR